MVVYQNFYFKFSQNFLSKSQLLFLTDNCYKTICGPVRTEYTPVRMISRFLPQVCAKIRHTHAFIHYVSVSTIEFVIVSICSFHKAEIL